MNITILAIESSCDDTSAAVLQNGIVLSNVIASQSVHEKYGGVVPELASRSHQQNIVPVVHQAIEQSGIHMNDISGIAFTRGPGLLGSLLVGTSFAKGFAMAQRCKLLHVNHLHAHVLASFIQTPLEKHTLPSFPFLCMLVSGGHTQIILAHSYTDMQILGSTIDDAAGEAFDKCAKVLGLPYPGGPHVDRLAQAGNPYAYSFSKPNIPQLDFSFSGLKTSVLYFLRDAVKQNPQFITEYLSDICASLQHSIVAILMQKLELAVSQTGVREIVIGGGVAANSGLRNAIQQKGITQGWNTYIPKIQYTTDNAAMIAVAGYYRFLANKFSSQDISPRARYTLEEYFAEK